MSTAPVPTRHYAGRSAQDRRADRRDRLIEAAVELFGSEGYQATSIEKLCARAGVSTRNFYQEFGGREALLIALHELINDRAFTAAAAALADADDEPLEPRIRRGVHAYLSTTSTDPRWTRIAYVELVGVSPAVEAHRIEVRARLCDWLESEARRAVLRGEATDRDFHYVAVGFIGAVNETLYAWETHGRPEPLDTITGELTRLVVAALTAP